jgi:hypothetical protein
LIGFISTAILQWQAGEEMLIGMHHWHSKPKYFANFLPMVWFRNNNTPM